MALFSSRESDTGPVPKKNARRLPAGILKESASCSIGSGPHSQTLSRPVLPGLVWRRGRDSNPRTPRGGQRFSRPPRSTAPAPLQTGRTRPRPRPCPAFEPGYTKTGGERGIRTLGTGLPYTRFPGVLLRPLGHLSVLPRPHECPTTSRPAKGANSNQTGLP